MSFTSLPPTPHLVASAAAAALQLSGCIEVVDMILDECDWSGVVFMANLNRDFRFVVFSYVRGRIERFLTKFISSTNIRAFFELLEDTKSAIVGSLVRCIMSVEAFAMYDRVHPLRLNITVPHVANIYMCEHTPAYRRWRRFLGGCGYTDEYGSGEGISPYHLSATSTSWSTLTNAAYPNLKISLIQSKTPSALSPVLQACHTSNFFAMSSSRIYCLYPKLFAARVNVNTRDRMPVLNCAFDSFNYGLTTFPKSDVCKVFTDRSCGEVCPSVWRHTYGLKGIGVFRWGGVIGIKDTGDVVSEPDIFGKRREMWRLQGECCNYECPAVAVCTNLLHAKF